MKTVPTDASVGAFIAAVDHAGRREDALALLDVYAAQIGVAPKMWGPSIIGYGSYDYARADGSKHTFALAGFSPRKANMSVYLMSGCKNHQQKLDKLGPHKTSVSCLYLGRLAKIDQDILAELITDDLAIMRERYPESRL
ncbi:MAG: DUF1801 domain-containing protein [Pseudomonadota bacterium]